MRIRTLAAMAVIPLALTLGACSSSGSNNGIASANGGTASASASSTANARDAQLKYAQCLRQHGVDVKDPDPGQPVRITNNNGSLDMTKLQAAQQACQSYMQQAAPDGGANDPAVHDAMVKYAECMRANGIDMPDPSAGGGIQMKGPAGGSDAKMQAAQAACQKYLPGAVSGGPQGGGPLTGGTGQ